MFQCKSCQQRDRLIAAQEEQIEFLQKLVSPPPLVTVTELEADHVLSGNQTVIEIPEVDLDEAEEAASERARILSGNF